MDEPKSHSGGTKALGGCLIVMICLFGAAIFIGTIATKIQPTASPSPTFPNHIVYADRSNLEPAFLRGMLENEFRELTEKSFPRYNYIQAKAVKAKGGYNLWAIHEFFNQYEFAAGDYAKVVQSWMEEHHSELKHANIVRVGVKGRSGYSWVSYAVD